MHPDPLAISSNSKLVLARLLLVDLVSPETPLVAVRVAASAALDPLAPGIISSSIM